MKKIIISIFSILFITLVYTQDGRILSKKLVDISKTPIWNKISENENLTSEYEYLNNLNIYTITYQSDNLPVQGIIIEPKKGGKYPVVIYNRGGNRNFGRLTIGQMIQMTSKLANQDYVVIGSNYRANDEFGGKDINDVLNLTKTIKEVEKADRNCLGMLGWSRGGMMTYLSLQKSEKIKTAVIGNGPTDLFEEMKFRPEMETYVYAECIPGYWNKKETELIKRSAIYWIDELNKNSSLLILCGTKDKRVNPEQADKIAKKLSEINYNYELRKFETDHFFSDKRNELNELLINWFNKELKNIN